VAGAARNAVTVVRVMSAFTFTSGTSFEFGATGRREPGLGAVIPGSYVNFQ
jgi:hypothetical protein